MNPILETEVVLNMLNTLLGKALFFSDTETANELEQLKHALYYEGASPDVCLTQLETLRSRLSHHG